MVDRSSCRGAGSGDEVRWHAPPPMASLEALSDPESCPELGEAVILASSTHSTRSRQLPGAGLASAVIALVLSGVLAGCSTNPPQAVLHVPGNYVANLRATPKWLNPTEATVLMCLDKASGVHLATGDGGEGSVGIIELDWAGTTYKARNNGDPVTMTTPVLRPGCGVLVFGVDCCHVDNYLAIKATKVDPEA